MVEKVSQEQQWPLYERTFQKDLFPGMAGVCLLPPRCLNPPGIQMQPVDPWRCPSLPKMAPHLNPGCGMAEGDTSFFGKEACSVLHPPIHRNSLDRG